jgi:hypothetical protein
MSGSTEINNLPTVNENITLEVAQQQQQYVPQSNIQQSSQPQSQNSNTMDNTTYNPNINNSNNIQQQSQHTQNTSQQNQFLETLQRASENGVTELPSRDIPATTQNIANDIQVTQDYIPNNPDPVANDHEIYDELIRRKKQKLKENDSLDDLYTDIQLPLLAAVIFFIFQLPFFQSNLYKYFPSIFLKDGNPSISVYVLKTTIFSISIYSLTKSIKYFSKF